MTVYENSLSALLEFAKECYPIELPWGPRASKASIARARLAGGSPSMLLRCAEVRVRFELRWLDYLVFLRNFITSDLKNRHFFPTRRPGIMRF
jgi:hypothetical protein